MFRHTLSHCMVAALFMIAAGTALAAPTVCPIDFEGLPGAQADMSVPTWDCGPLTVSFSTTNPNPCVPYLGDWGEPGQGWLCNQNGTNDVTIPPYSGGLWFLTWVACDPRANDMVVEFSQVVERFEGYIFDIDDGWAEEEFIIRAYRANGSIADQMTVNRFSPAGGGDCGVQHWEVAGTGIKKVTFDGSKPTDNLGFGIDNLEVTYDPAQGPGINKDLTNIGTIDAYDVSIVLKGSHLTSWEHMGGFKNFFTQPYPFPGGSNTLLKWSYFVDPNNPDQDPDPIRPGDMVHIGWQIIGSDGIGTILDMYWTDEDGERILGSKICQTAAHFVYVGGTPIFSLANDFVPDSDFGDPVPLTIADLFFQIRPEAIDLDSLNLDNAALNAAFESIPGTWTIAPGESISVDIPMDVPADQYILARYTVDCPNGCAGVIDFVQLPTTPDDEIPTLTEWGLIIFVMLLMGCMAWVFVRRRKMAAVSI